MTKTYRKDTIQAAFDELMIVYKYNILAFIREMFEAEPTFQQLLFLADAVAGESSRVAVKSCTSSGKTACLAWLILWGLAVEDDIRILVTAPTFPLLNRVLRTEIDKWHLKMPKLVQDMYDMTQSVITRKGQKTHRCDFATASSDNEQALAGGHSGNYWIIADEGAAIDDYVYEVLMGTLSYGSSGRFLITSNPTRSFGFYYELFSTNNKHWKLHTFDAFHTPHVSKEYIEEVRDTYGIDHDFYRVRILGQFPRASSTQFFEAEVLESALSNTLDPRSYYPFEKIAGVDVARFGDDATVLTTRQGPKLVDRTLFRGLNTMEVAGLVFDYWKQHNHKAVMVDGTGLGAGVVDRARELGVPVVDVIVGSTSSNPKKYMNVKTQLMGSMKDWIANGADLSALFGDKFIRREFLAIEYGYNKKMQMCVATKKDTKSKNKGYSPDTVDSIGLTFADDVYLTTRTRQSSCNARSIKVANYAW
jgi:hypothetical protein